MDSLENELMVNVPVRVKVGFLNEIHRAMKLMGYKDRSQFIRDAIRDKIVSRIPIPEGLADANSRAGVGGKPGRRSLPVIPPAPKMRTKEGREISSELIDAAAKAANFAAGLGPNPYAESAGICATGASNVNKPRANPEPQRGNGRKSATLKSVPGAND